MIREQEIYILEWLKKYKLNITLISLVFETGNPNFVGFSDQKAFLRMKFAVQYLHQEIPNDIPINNFLPGNIPDNMNTFDGN